MSWEKMSTVSLNEGNPQNFAYEAEHLLSSVTTGSWILIPDEIRFGLTVTVSFTDAAAGKVETTTSPLVKVKNNTAIAVAWSSGIVSVTSQDAIISPITAIRANQTSIGGGAGTMLMSIRAQ